MALALLGCSAAASPPTTVAVAPYPAPVAPYPAPIPPRPLPVPVAPAIVVADFSAAAWDQWQNQALSFWGSKNTYSRVTGPDGQPVAQAQSDGSASMFVRLVSFSPDQMPIAHWRWKVSGPVAGADERTKSGDDAAARVYFAWNLTQASDLPNAQALCYIWGNTRQVGEVGFSPYTNQEGIITLRSGSMGAGQWQEETRNLFADFQQVFHQPPPGPVTAVALMTDTDQTKSQATAWYGPIDVRAAAP